MGECEGAAGAGVYGWGWVSGVVDVGHEEYRIDAGVRNAIDTPKSALGTVRKDQEGH